MKGLWVLPSRRRIEKLSRFFASAIAAEISTPGIVLVQSDELAELRSAYSKISLPSNWRIIGTQSDGFADKHREVWDAISDLDWIGIACDDLRPQTPQWDKRLVARVTGTNIVTCNDTQQGSNRMAGITVFSGKLARALGYIFPPHFWHTFVDNVWEDLGRATGCWTYVDDVVVLHDHPFTNQRLDPAKTDETALKSYGQSERDQRAYVNWRQTEFAAACERIKQCQLSS